MVIMRMMLFLMSPIAFRKRRMCGRGIIFMMMVLMVKLLVSTIVVMGWRRSNQSSWLSMIWTSMCFSLKNIRGKGCAIAHSITVSEMPMVPFLLQILFQIALN